MTEDFGKNRPPYEGKKPGKSGVSAASLDVGLAKVQNGQKSEMDFRLVLCQPLRKTLLLHDIDFCAILVAQFSRVIGVAQQARIISHHKGREKIQ